MEKQDLHNAQEIISQAFGKVSKHLDNDNQNRVVKSLRNTFTDIPEALKNDWISLRTRQSQKSLSHESAEAEYRAMLSTDYMRYCGTVALVRTLEQHGATFSPDDKAFLCDLDNGEHTFSKSYKATPDELYDEAKTKAIDASEQAIAFMNGKIKGHTNNRRTDLSLYLRTGTKPRLHAYVVMKDGLPCNGEVVEYGDDLIIPTTNAFHPDLKSGWQTINAGTEKRFTGGMKPNGQFHPIGDLHDADLVLVCEGWATGESLHAATSLPVACALSMQNMLKVAISLLDPEFELKARRVLLVADTGHDNVMRKYVNIIRSNHSDNVIDWVSPEGRS
ncbi:MAG: hypothetical protein Q7U74_00310 [Saprospiraceae bacterium]|nr:hypothetical protein [Saprospiraceae bacterium]